MLHFTILGQPSQHLSKYACCLDVRRFDNAVVHPAPLASRPYNSGPAHVRQMPADLGLVCSEDFDKETDTHLVLAHQVQESEPGTVCQCTEEPFLVESTRLFAHNKSILTHLSIYGLTYVPYRQILPPDIRIGTYHEAKGEIDDQ